LATDLKGPWWWWTTGYVLINVAGILSIWSMMIYLTRAWPILKNSMK